MSLKAELETWAAALKAYDEEDFEKSLQLFAQIADSSKILTNMGLIYATLGEHEVAVQQFTAACQLDGYLAVAYFQCGVSNFLLQRFENAARDFDDALMYLRGNQDINYDQLGLKFQLWSAEVLFNKGLALINMGQEAQGLADMREALREKSTEEHNVIDDAIADRGQGYTVFSIPVGVIYRPSDIKLKNAKTKDYLGKAKLVVAADEAEAYTEFSGVKRLQQGISPSGAVLDGAAMLARSATVATPASRQTDNDRPPMLQRAQTTINTMSAPSARSDVSRSPSTRSPGRSNAFADRPAGGAALGRSATSGGTMRVPLGGATRGLSIRKPNADSGSGSSADGARQAPSQRVTEFYDEYLDSYAESDAPPLPAGNAPRRSATSAGSGRSGQAQHQRARSVPQNALNGAGGGSMRRRPTQRGTTRASSRAPSRAVSIYEEDEEDEYGSGEDEEDVIKIRVKLHYRDDVRGMALPSDMPWDEFLERVTGKFGRGLDGLGMKFKDEDGVQVSLRDEMDYELAIETVRESAKGKREGRLEIWCSDE